MQETPSLGNSMTPGVPDRQCGHRLGRNGPVFNMKWSSLAFVLLLVGCDSAAEIDTVAGRWSGEFIIQLEDSEPDCDRYNLWTIELTLAQPGGGQASGTGSLSEQEVFDGSGCQNQTQPRSPVPLRITGTVAGDGFALELWLSDDMESPSFTYNGALVEGQLFGTFFTRGGLTSATLIMDRQ